MMSSFNHNHSTLHWYVLSSSNEAYKWKEEVKLSIHRWQLSTQKTPWNLHSKNLKTLQLVSEVDKVVGKASMQISIVFLYASR